MPSEPVRSPRVLLLEDADDIRLLLDHLLRTYGWETLAVATPEEALTVPLDAVDLALLDIMLPRGDGRAVASALRQRGAAFPIYYLTGVPSAIREDDRRHVQGVLIKPFSMPELQAVLDRAAPRRDTPGTGTARQQSLELMTSLAAELEAFHRSYQSHLERQTLRPDGPAETAPSPAALQTEAASMHARLQNMIQELHRLMDLDDR